MEKLKILLLDDPGNEFAALVKAMWCNGEDGERIAKKLAKTLVAVIQDGTHNELHKELDRLLSA